jgi:uncharacterized ferritin-like protein (DUF455 family)
VSDATLTDAAIAVLTTPAPDAKVALSREAATAWRAGGLALRGTVAPPDRPARPLRPELLAPRHMPKRRRAGSLAGRIALLHALAHIELNAVDLAWDIIARFARLPSGAPLPRGFYDDWVTVAAEEAEHFALLSVRLAELGGAYGDLPAHDGLWEASQKTAHDLAARLAVVPLVLEARGLDVTPQMEASLRHAGDDASAAILRRIHDDEIGHVAAGRRWFEAVCADAGGDPAATWQELVAQLFKGELKRPFNDASRARAGMPAAWYEPLAGG